MITSGIQFAGTVSIFIITKVLSGLSEHSTTRESIGANPGVDKIPIYCSRSLIYSSWGLPIYGASKQYSLPNDEPGTVVISNLICIGE